MAKQETKKPKVTKSGPQNVLSPDTVNVQAPEKKLSTIAFSTAVRVLLQNWRQGTVGCKGRSDVSYSNRKPWKQKGTGRARAGSARSPLWRHGGVIFGPQERTRVLKVSRKLKQGVLGSLAYERLNAGQVLCLDWSVEGDKPKTSAAFTALKNAGLANSKVTVFLPAQDVLTYTSFMNIPNVRVLFYDQPNTFDLVQAERWVVFKKDIEQFKEMVEKWN